MITAVIALAALVVLLAGLWFRDHRRLSGDVADEKRRVQDTNSEWQEKYDRAVAATIVRLRDLLPLEDETLAAIESEGVQGVLATFRERVSMMNAATQHAQSKITEAAATVNAVNAENTLHRQLLERALEMPIETPEAIRQMFLRRCRTVLTSPRATFDCPSEEFWTQYVEHHVRLHGGISTDEASLN